MAMTTSLLSRAAWLSRTAEFGALRDSHGHDGAPRTLMRYRRPDYFGQTRATELWCALPAHRFLLEAVAADRDWVDLRYAAIDWKVVPAMATRGQKLTWALELAEVLEHVARAVDAGELGWLASPFVTFDLEQRVRLGFSPVDQPRLPPETLKRWPRCDERGLVFVVGKLLARWAYAPDETIAPIIARCTAQATRRYPALADLQDALRSAGAQPAPARNDAGWQHVEIALGNLLTGWPGRARDHLEHARDHALARALLHELDAARVAARSSAGSPVTTTGFASPRPRPVESAETLAVRARGLLAARRPDEALACAEALVALEPTSGRAHYLRGRCLLALRRLTEARDTFARAATLSPQLLEAMLLRREAERALANLRAQVGTQPAIAIELPAHLAPLAGVIAEGNLERAITILERDHAGDAAAQRVLANCLAFARRFEDAVAAFERAEQLDPADTRPVRIGKGFALLELDRPAEALALFDGYPEDLEALEGRPCALERLGRAADADRAFGRLLEPGKR